jgi:serine/threonine protein kinase
VKLAKDSRDGQIYALKYMKKTHTSMDQKYYELLVNEVKMMQELEHDNIVRLIHMNDNGVIQKSNGKEIQVLYLVLQLVTGGELFEYIATTGKFSDPIARFYFHQLIDALEYIHGKGISHRDLKAENLLLASDFNLKLADFGFSIPLAGRDGSGFLHTYLGTPT